MSYMEAYRLGREKLSGKGELHAELRAIEGEDREISDRLSGHFQAWAGR